MSAHHSTKWFWSDWIGDQAVRRLTPAERGVWIDLLALAADGNPTGYVCDAQGRPLPLDEIARVTNAGSPEEAAKLIDGIVEKGVASRDRTGRLFNRRMVRDADLAAKRSRAGKVGAAHTNLINQQFRELSQQMPRHLPQQNSRAQPPPYPIKNKTLSSENSAARASNGSAVNKPPHAISRQELDELFAKKVEQP